MLRHFVFIKYKEGTSEAHMAEFCRRIRGLRDSIPVIRSVEAGRDALRSGRSWDVLLAMSFDSIDALNEYQVHPAHQVVIAFNQPQVAEVGAVDYYQD
jgi:hypothetical protein